MYLSLSLYIHIYIYIYIQYYPISILYSIYHICLYYMAARPWEADELVPCFEHPDARPFSAQ